MSQFADSKIHKELKNMKKQEILKENAKMVKSISDVTVESLKQLSEAEGKVIVDFEDMDHYQEYQVLVKEGYVEKEYRSYSITEKGTQLLEAYGFYKADEKKFEKAIQENDNKLSIEYKHHDEEKNLIENAIATFDVEADGLPVIVVNEEAYAGLIHRQKGQHWRQYLGEDGRNLIRQKKLSRFYVEDETTARRYLYIVPTK